MNPAQPMQRGNHPAPQESPSDFERLIKQPSSKTLEYTPFGSSDKIKLTVEIVQKFIATRTKRGATCSDRDAIRFMMMCQARRLNPFEGDAFLLGYDGKDGPVFSLITAHQAFLKRAEVHPEYDGMQSGIIIQNEDGSLSEVEGDFHLPDQKVVGGWARVFFKNRKYPCYRPIRLARFKQDYGVWQDDAAGMICKCAEADALRSSFPTMLGGLYLNGEIKLDNPSVPIDMPSNLVQVVGAPHRSDNPQPETTAAAAPNPDEAAEAAAGLAPEQPAKPSPARVQEQTGKTPHQELQELVEGAGGDFTSLQAFCTKLGSVPNIDSMASYDEIPSADVKRILGGKRGIIAGVRAEMAARTRGGAQ